MCHFIDNFWKLPGSMEAEAEAEAEAVFRFSWKRKQKQKQKQKCTASTSLVPILIPDTINYFQPLTENN